MMDITIGQTAGHQLSEVMAELLRERTLTRLRRVVARMEPALSEKRLRVEEAVQRERAGLEELEMRAARVRYGLASLELEVAQEKLDEAYYWSSAWRQDVRESMAALEAGDYEEFDSDDPNDVVLWLTDEPVNRTEYESSRCSDGRGQ